jgi:hypothetical protein
MSFRILATGIFGAVTRQRDSYLENEEPKSGDINECDIFCKPIRAKEAEVIDTTHILGITIPNFSKYKDAIYGFRRSLNE